MHWAPPCGTFSRAREIRRPGAPPPLRNQRHIKGFPHLRGTNLRGVQSANALVEFVAAQCRALSAKGICWSIENPTNSLMWSYPDLARAIGRKPLRNIRRLHARLQTPKEHNHSCEPFVVPRPSADM